MAKRVGRRGLSVPMAEDGEQWLKEKLDHLEEKIVQQESKIEDAIEKKKPGALIESYQDAKKRLVKVQDDLRTALLARLASPAGGALEKVVSVMLETLELIATKLDGMPETLIMRIARSEGEILKLSASKSIN
ncbi:hypothetical protein COCOBI_14-0600 [Coccomyxa sp. Obi]|nr:hypothetical protein COCOBI_14-0600 [Coccomyxa sp. Obi]